VSATVVVAMHDGFYGAGTGAGFANRGFVTTLADLLAPDVGLTLLPIYLAPDSPEFQAVWHRDSVAICAAIGASVHPIDNGTAGGTRFGGVGAFEQAAKSAASVLSELVLPVADPVFLVLVDVPFFGVPALLPTGLAPCVAMVPRSTGLLHDPDNEERIGYEQRGLQSLASCGGRVAAISSYMRGHLEYGYGLPPDSIVELSDGLTADEWELRPPAVVPQAATEGFVLAYARAQPYKGWDDLVDALALLRDRGVVVPHALLAAVTDQPGTTDYQDRLAARIDELALNATLLTRFDPAIRGLLSHPALRALIVASRTEPFGRVPLEGYAAGAAPVVVTRAGGLPEQVIDGVTGFVAEAADPGSLADAISRAVGLSPAERQSMRERGLALAHDRFDHRQAVARFFAAVAPWVLRH
jgi:glycosyltransferase involved in cell wall biosynthesis